MTAQRGEDQQATVPQRPGAGTEVHDGICDAIAMRSQGWSWDAIRDVLRERRNQSQAAARTTTDD